MLAVCSVCLHVRVDMPGVHTYVYLYLLKEQRQLSATKQSHNQL